MFTFISSQFPQVLQVSLLLVSINFNDGLMPTQAAALVSTVSTPDRGVGVITNIPKKKVYKHLFRHYDDVGFDSLLRCTDPYDFLHSVGYSQNEIEQLSKDYPPLLEQNTHSHLAPKIRFLVETMGGGSGTLTWSSEENDYASPMLNHQDDDDDDDEEEEEEECLPFDDSRSQHTMRVSKFVKTIVPAWFFGCNLDRIVGPRHAYLVHHNLPHGSKLLHEHNGEFFLDFLQTCNNDKKISEKSFLDLCHKWETSSRSSGDKRTTASYSNDLKNHHTTERLETFERLFGAGLLPATRTIPFINKDSKNAEATNGITISPDELVNILVAHGSNYLEYDSQGMTPLHWAAATGKVMAVKTLLQILEPLSLPAIEDPICNKVADFILGEVDAKGATSFHWACCGLQPGRTIGSGGSLDICRTMLEKSGESRGDVANAKTWSESTPLMWASWASSDDSHGNLAIVDLLTMHGADPHAKDSKGRSTAHWAAAAGNLNTCQYLHKSFGVNFNLEDNNGNTPLDYAESFSRQDVVDWLSSTFHVDDD